LTLFEVEAALTRLQEQACSQTEIVMGVINDERMEDRVQVTLIITGLGAPTLEETLSGVARPRPIEPAIQQPSPAPVISEQPTLDVPLAPLTASPSANDIDLPAFLRKRMRYSG